MRIVSPHCGMAPGSNSGGEVYERELLTRMSQVLGVEIEVLMARHLRVPEAFKGRVVRLPIRRGLRWWNAPAIIMPALKRAWPFDVLRIHSLRFMGPAAIWARRRWGWRVPLVAHHHHLDPGPLNALDRWVMRHVDRVVVGSAVSRDAVLNDRRRARTDYAPFSVVPYGVDAVRYAPGPPREFRQTIVFVGGLKRRKGLRRFIEYDWPIVRDTVPAAHLVIVGDGPERRRLEVLAYEQQYFQTGRAADTRITFTGRVDDDTKLALLQDADVFAFPSALEGFGLAVAEAMSCGLPIAYNGNPTVGELVGTPSWEWPNLVSELVILLRNPERAREVGRAMRQRVLDRFTWDRCVRETLAVYQREVARSA